ncbi:MAG: cation:proton antiporter [Chloroflexi bacterium]|nr:cation:proton antiporter [Chloroflexota bacterium]
MAAWLIPSVAYASSGWSPEPNTASVFGWLVIILVLARLASLVERVGQPPVLGEILVGVLLGNLILVGVQAFEAVKVDSRVGFLAQLGVVILLFQVGLETDIEEMRRVGVRALLVACAGVAVPFLAVALLVGPVLVPGLPVTTYIFLGGTLSATSVGITARVFRDLGRTQTPEARIVLGAAVIDDVLGLLILAVVSAIVVTGTADWGSVAWIALKAGAFLLGAIVLGNLAAAQLTRFFALIHTGIGMKFTLAIGFALTLAYLADLIGLAPIVGSFAAGIILEPIHFRQFDVPRIIDEVRGLIRGADPALKSEIGAVIEHHADRHVEDIIEPLSYFLVPIFFVLTGMSVKLDVLFNLPVLLVAIGITVVAIAGKVMAGFAAGKVNKWVVGWGMVPRGEVELIFAATGRALGVFSDELYSVLIVMVVLCTLIAPPVLAYLLRKSAREA